MRMLSRLQVVLQSKVALAAIGFTLLAGGGAVAATAAMHNTSPTATPSNGSNHKAGKGNAGQQCESAHQDKSEDKSQDKDDQEGAKSNGDDKTTTSGKGESPEQCGTTKSDTEKPDTEKSGAGGSISGGSATKGTGGD
jgi:hypothetical protein